MSCRKITHFETIGEMLLYLNAILVAPFTNMDKPEGSNG